MGRQSSHGSLTDVTQKALCERICCVTIAGRLGRQGRTAHAAHARAVPTREYLELNPGQGTADGGVR